MTPRPGAGRRPDPGQSLAQDRRRASRYDAELAVFDTYRREAIARLALQSGERVIDVGCGTGLSFRGVRDRGWRDSRPRPAGLGREGGACVVTVTAQAGQA